MVQQFVEEFLFKGIVNRKVKIGQKKKKKNRRTKKIREPKNPEYITYL